MNARKLYRRLYRRRDVPSGRTYLTVSVPQIAAEVICEQRRGTRATVWMRDSSYFARAVEWAPAPHGQALVTWTIKSKGYPDRMRRFCGAFSREWPRVAADWQSARMLRCGWPYTHQPKGLS